MHSASQLPGKQATQPYAPDLLDQAVRRILRPSLAAARSHRRAINLVPLNLRPQLWENDHVYGDGGRASYRQRKPAREVFLALLLKRDSFCGPILRRPSAGPRFDKALAAPFGLQ